MDSSAPSSTLSGILFLLYVLAALVLTAFLLLDLVRLAGEGRTRHKAASVTPQAGIFALLALVSFSMLSYNMLSFLLVHYRDWSTVRNLAVATPGSGASFVSLDAHLLSHAENVWEWLTGARLFECFARELLTSGAVTWWVQCALLHSVLVAVYMEVEGTRRMIPHLWAYHVLAQILPFSFIQNLFFLAVRLKPIRQSKDGRLHVAPGGNFWPPESLIQIAYALLVGSSIMNLLNITKQANLLPTIFIIRLLIFLPHWIMKPATTEGINTKDKPIATRQMDDTQAWDEWHHHYKWTYRITALIYLVRVVSLSFNTEGGQISGVEASISALVHAARASPAVAALGFDWLWGLISLLIAGRLGGPTAVSE